MAATSCGEGVQAATCAACANSLWRLKQSHSLPAISRSAIHSLTDLGYIGSQAGNVPETEMFRTFNMGVGMVVVVGKEGVDKALAAGVGAFVMGEIVEGEGVIMA